MQIAFWSAVHGQTTTTSNAIAIACMIALEYRLKILITHNHYERSTLESALLNEVYLKTDLTQLKDTGIDALSRFIKFNALDRESISSYTTTILRGRMDLLMGTKSINKALYLSNLNDVIETIINSAKAYYNLLIVDVASGYNELSKKVLNNAELIVVNLNQNKNVLDEFFKKDYEPIKDKCFFLISLYDAESKYNLKNIQRKYKIKAGIAKVPYCRAYADACNDGKAVEFFMRNLQCDEDDAHYPFINSVRKSVMCLLKQLEIDIENRRSGD